MGDLKLGDEGARLLAGSVSFRPVTLNLGENDIGPEGSAALAVSPFLGRLRDLNLGDNKIGDAGLTALALAAPPGHYPAEAV